MQGIPNKYWAKFSQSRPNSLTQPSFLELRHHLVDVAVCFEQLLTSGYALSLARAAGMATLTIQQEHRLCFFAFLHDLGKAAVDFQRQIFEGENQVRKHRGHTTLCTFFFTASDNNPSAKAFNDWLPIGCETWFAFKDEDGFETLARLLLATWGHHGTPIDFDLISGSQTYTDVRWDGWRYADFAALLTDLMLIAQENWPRAFDTGFEIEATAAFLEEFNGILQLADWIASDTNIFPYEFEDQHSVRRTFADQAAGMFLSRTGKATVSLGNTFEEAFGFTPNPMQSAFLTISSELIQ
jgi:CRISPR-associated endonuclease/helicase Cas3